MAVLNQGATAPAASVVGHPVTGQAFTPTESTIRNIACMSVSELVEYYIITGEDGGSSDNRETIDYCSRLIDVIEAVGNLKFPDEFQVALESA